MGRTKEPEQPTSNPVEAKKYRDESTGHTKNGNHERALASLDKEICYITVEWEGYKRVRKHIQSPWRPQLGRRNRCLFTHLHVT
ncbi:unnamed protein product [Colias eurytheme]|nr:unnamed protein product [Colias eurytheme]